MKKLISVLIPAYNEEEVLDMLMERLGKLAADQPKYNWEFMFVNDGSRDRTLEIIKQYAERDTRVSYINLSRNFGKETAMIAGFDHVRGDAVVNIDADLQDPPELIPQMIKYWEDGYDDVFVYAPVRAVAELGNRLLAFDGCMNFFSGPQDKNFSATVNLYDCHYTSTHIMGTTGGNNDDLIEANRLAAEGVIQPAVMVTHVGGIDAVAETTLNLPKIPGGKKLIYTQIDMPLTAIEDFAKLGEKEPFFLDLDRCCRAHNGLWNGEAEKMLLEHFKVEI